MQGARVLTLLIFFLLLYIWLGEWKDTAAVQGSELLKTPYFECMVIFVSMFKMLVTWKKKENRNDAVVIHHLTEISSHKYKLYMKILWVTGSISVIFANVAISYSANCRDVSGEGKKRAILQLLAVILVLNIWLKTIIITHVTY